MTDPNAPPPGSGDLQFERVEGAATTAGMTCSSCGNPIVASYYDVNGNHVCLACKGRAERANEPVRGFAPFAKAFVFGFAACLLGAGIYYGIAAALNLEIGLVAILIGFMVGAAIRRATGGGGGRRYQVLALLLTYFSIGLAYSPFAVKGAMSGSGKSDSAAADSTRADSAGAADSTTDRTASSKDAADTPTPGGLAGAFAIVLGGGALLVFALPLIVIFGDMPGGLISAAIIGFGMQQAWRMTAAQVAVITGPYRVGDGNAPAASAPTA